MVPGANAHHLGSRSPGERPESQRRKGPSRCALKLGLGADQQTNDRSVHTENA